ncbi:MAG: excinuclease ABC subunit UvrA [Desulfobacterales bacterium]
MESDKIIINGARQHNLKNIDLELPRNRLVVITGLSGSGKSTLAFDTLYAEGQRRYVESLSTYARQFLERMEKPDVDYIEGLSPAISIEQKTAGHNPRSTVGTVTEIYDYLRLLFARVGTPHCYKCGKPIIPQNIDQILDQITQLSEGTKIIILAPIVMEKNDSWKKKIKRLQKEGFARIRVNGKIFELEDSAVLEKKKKSTLEVVVDRLVIKEGIRNRLADSLEMALSLSDGLIEVDVLGGCPVIFSEKAVCVSCNISYPEFTPASFSFNSPRGACPKCGGLGSITEIDPELIIPNKNLSLREGAVVPWASKSTVRFFEFMDALTRRYGVDIYEPVKNLPRSFIDIILYGSGNDEITFYFENKNRRYTYQKAFEGIIARLERRYLETESSQSREEIKQFMTFRPCSQCHGSRLNLESRSVKMAGQNITEITALCVSKAIVFFEQLDLEGQKRVIGRRILKEIAGRLKFLKNVGLGYLTLDRAANTLSGGESQRIRLATQIGSKLTGVLYVLDEPSIGLHQRDNQRLLDTLTQMRDLGNTVLVVEHDVETIETADYVVDMGPGAGINGGHVVFSGIPSQLRTCEASLTGQYLSGKRQISLPLKRRSGNGQYITIEGASENNLKNIDVRFPLGCFICVTGVSGSGKSTLVLETLYQGLSQNLYRSHNFAGRHRKILGIEHVDKVIHIDQSPIGKTPRSNPGTYIGVFSFIRELFSRTPEARARGYKPGRFSFNVKGGRCEACSGDGVIKIEMHFLPDVYVPCDVCRAKRYNRETLEIHYKGKSIADVLDMTVNQAYRFFENIGNIRNKLQTVVDVGLGYIRLGQPATTLSGGEAQRVKLSRELSRRGSGKTIYILDEPTTGLHMEDIRKLLEVLNCLVDSGNTIVVIEHHMDVVKSADYIIDLGPEGGDGGGFVVGFGTPEKLVENNNSHTGKFLKKYLQS